MKQILICLLLFVTLQQIEASNGQNDVETIISGVSQPRKFVGTLSSELPSNEKSGQIKRENLSSTLHSDGLHRPRIFLTVFLDEKETELDLHLNTDIISKGYFEKTQQDNRTVITQPSYKNAEICYYHGKIQGKNDSWAAISTCDNIIRGTIFDGRQLHYIEPDSDVNEGKNDQTENKFNLLHLKQTDFKQNAKVPPEMNRIKRSETNPDKATMFYNVNSRYVEMVIVVDNKMYKELGADLKTVRRRTKDIASIVNSLYAPLNIGVALVGIVVWSETDEINITTNGDETLSSFLNYRKKLVREHPNDYAQLLTGVDFESFVVSKALQGAICSYRYSGGVISSGKNNSIGITATTVSHSLAHNFGVSHDRENCSCSNSNGGCIMAPNSNRGTQWSSCSLKDFEHAFAHGMDYCLRNKPNTLYDGPTCGNGFTEPGEQCDCGLPDLCDNPCCDAATCQMYVNATCASGGCCDLDTCQVKSNGTLCREADKVCDLSEYCTGESERCPEDVKKMNGVTCDTPSGQAYCYSGDCRTHTDQCRLLWGRGNVSNDMCFEKNVIGSRHAHCGYNFTTEAYEHCETEDVKCGILHCQTASERLEFGNEDTSILASFFVNIGGKIYPCRSVILDFGLTDINPGMVPDGAKCGEDKMCVNQKCVSVQSILG